MPDSGPTALTGYAGIKDIRMFIKSQYKYRKMRNNSKQPEQERETERERGSETKSESKQATKSIMQQGTMTGRRGTGDGAAQPRRLCFIYS